MDRFTAKYQRRVRFFILRGSFGIIAYLFAPIPLDSVVKAQDVQVSAYKAARPYTRWWWHAGIYSKRDIRDQLVWLKDQGFGGVELAFIYPVNRNPQAPRFRWLGDEWQKMVVYAKHCCDSLDMGCDFTYGSLWPFGGTFVQDADRTRRWGDSSFRQFLRLTWEHPDTGYVINHLDSNAFSHYAEILSPAFKPAMRGGQSALFCDSWEVETYKIWTPGLEKTFENIYGYDIMPYMDQIYAPENAGPRYDYMKLLSDLAIHNFFEPWNAECHKLGGLSRAQIAGAPVDVIEAYSRVDIPETEAMLYEPEYALIVSSAAALAGKPIVSAESFTCLYGWPRKYMFEEQTADLKLVADALFAHGVNHIIWHGTPLNPAGWDTIAFYATVHVGKRGKLSKDLKSFNDYLTRVSQAMRYGHPYTDIAVYLPLEDAWIAGELPPEKQLPWSWGAYEMRYIYRPSELSGYHPLWVNAHHLKNATILDGKLHVNGRVFDALYVDVQSLDFSSLETIYAIASASVPIILKKQPQQAGFIKNSRFQEILNHLLHLSNVYFSISEARLSPPIIEGNDLPLFWVRMGADGIKIFFANPKARNLKYPLAYGQAYQEESIMQEVKINYKGHSIPLRLVFEPYQSLLLSITPEGNVEYEDIRYFPDPPTRN